MVLSIDMDREQGRKQQQQLLLSNSDYQTVSNLWIIQYPVSEATIERCSSNESCFMHSKYKVANFPDISRILDIFSKIVIFWILSVFCLCKDDVFLFLMEWLLYCSAFSADISSRGSILLSKGAIRKGSYHLSL